MKSVKGAGSATDLWAAYREGAFAPAGRPWLGYLMLLEETTSSMTAVRAREPHFRVFPEFREASYAKRYEVLLTKMVRERLYDSACLILTRTEGNLVKFREPSPELSFRTFMSALTAKVLAAEAF